MSEQIKSLEVFRQDDADQMERIERAIDQAILPFAENTDPILAVLALTRRVRTMLDAASAEARKDLLPVLIKFLRGDTPAPDRSPLLWMPGDGRKH